MQEQVDLPENVKNAINNLEILIRSSKLTQDEYGALMQGLTLLYNEIAPKYVVQKEVSKDGTKVIPINKKK